MQLLGIGGNGHIGFNEPGEAFEKERQETEVGSAAIGAVVETNGNIRKNCEI